MNTNYLVKNIIENNYYKINRYIIISKECANLIKDYNKEEMLNAIREEIMRFNNVLYKDFEYLHFDIDLILNMIYLYNHSTNFDERDITLIAKTKESLSSILSLYSSHIENKDRFYELLTDKISEILDESTDKEFTLQYIIKHIKSDYKDINIDVKIINKYLKEKYRLKYIYGLQIIHKIRFRDKIIYLFGEQHRPNPEIILHPQYLNPIEFIDGLSLVYHDSKIFDIFVESKYMTSYDSTPILDYHDNSYMIQFIKKYNDCLSYSNKKCPENMRMHYIDYRRTKNTTPQILDDFYFSEDEMSNVDALSYLTNNESNILSSFIEFNDDEIRILFSLFMENKVYKTTKIIKNLENFDENDQILKMYVQKFFTNKLYELYYSFIKNNTNKTHILNIATCIVDYYTVSRMLRKFKNDESLQNIIYLSGSFHSKNVYDFFTYLKENCDEYNISIESESSKLVIKDKTLIKTQVNIEKFKPFF